MQQIYSKNSLNYIINASGITVLISYWSHQRNLEKEQRIFRQFLSQFKNLKI